jgi:hypothetical protein
MMCHSGYLLFAEPLQWHNSAPGLTDIWFLYEDEYMHRLPNSSAFSTFPETGVVLRQGTRFCSLEPKKKQNERMQRWAD